MGQAQSQKVVPAEVRMISGCQDAQTSADVSNVTSFKLPDPAGNPGGACTSALLNVLYKDHKTPEDVMSFVEVLQAMRTILQERRYTQIPQFTSSKPIDVNMPFHLVPDGATGTKRALLIGINYVGQNPGELSGCHNDALNMKEYIKDIWGFEEENITVLLDDGESEPPTMANILANYEKLVAESESGDSLFCHYSGHGVKIRDDDLNEEADGYDEALVPVDYQENGVIRDDDLFMKLVHPLKSGVTLTCLMDCCHSGTILDLPYKYKADSTRGEIELDDGVNIKKFFDKVGEIFDDGKE